MSETTLIIFVGGAVIAALVVAVWLILRQIRQQQAPRGEGLDLVLQQMNELSKVVDSKIGETSKQMNETVRHQFSDSQRLIQQINDQVNRQLQDVSKGQTEMKERSNQIFTIAEQLQDLQRTLKSQKERGNFGESSLELILGNILPPDVYELQYRFEDGTAVDAVIHARDGIIPVDAKFSLESYSQLINEKDETRQDQFTKQFKEDLKKRIDETAKYIKPKEGTLPFAFMFIPAEGIYYDLLVNRIGGLDVNARNLVDYAMNDKKVIIVSPTTFYAYLQSVLYGFNAFKIEKNAEAIQKNVGELSRHINRYDEYFKKIGKSLSTTVNHYNSADKELLKIDKDVTRITGEASGVEGLQLDRPQEREE
ncbi:MAG: DNA recombination protein RmuC [Candidatus Paceibacterota bacterium]